MRETIDITVEDVRVDGNDLRYTVVVKSIDFNEEEPTHRMCPPHIAVVSIDDRLVCDVCERELDKCCLACVVEPEGFNAAHTCEVVR